MLRISMSATASGPLLEDIKFPKSELLWSQAFYYGIWAAILYFIDASLMTATFWGASRGFYGKQFTLSLSQRTLMLQTVAFLLYLLLGARVFAKVEGWNYLDSVYWADATLFTIGFGDFAPQTTVGRCLLIPYVLLGIVSVGLVIDSIRSLILARGKRQFTIRMDEKRRRKVVRAMIRKQEDEFLQPIRGAPTVSCSPSSTIPTEFERRRAEFALMRKIQDQASSRGRWMVMASSAVSWVVLWLVGAVIFQRSENPYQGWSYFDAFYFCFVAWTTVGYGDLTPISNAGRSFFVFWSLLALPIITMLISHASNTVVDIVRYGIILLGKITILPGDEGFVENMKHIISMVTLGKVFPSHLVSASPSLAPSFESTDQKVDEVIAAHRGQICRGYERSDPSTSAMGQLPSQSQHERRWSYLRHPDIELPSGTNFHFLLISEIKLVAAHLKEPKPHRYTFDEWAWFLKLIGEDEHSAKTHCMVRRVEKHQRRSAIHENAGQELVWSWVGSPNPLLSILEESEWVFHRLAERLWESLLAERRRQLQDLEGAKAKALSSSLPGRS
jgi:potassium channel subfamily K, other eukaryote